MSHLPAKLTPFDSWALARVRAGMTFDDEIGRVSKSLRPLIQRLEEASQEEGERIWEEHIEAIAEEGANSLIESVAGANPDDPAPEDDGWGAPELEKPVIVEPLPVDIFPVPVARLIREGAKAIGCAPDFLGMTVLPVTGTAIGRSVTLRIKEDYFASPVFYVANISKPGDGKSPAMNAVVRPLWRIDETEHKRFKEAMQEYDRARDAFELAKKTRIRPQQDKAKRAKIQTAEAIEEIDDTHEFDLPTEPVPPIRPTLGRCVVDDATTESLAVILSENPRGLLLAKDELTALMGSLNQYKSGKGTDRQFFLSSWSGASIVVDRKGTVGREPFRVPHPHLGIVGGMPPDMLGELAESRSRDDGFVDRMLFAFPDPMPKLPWSDEGIPKETSEAWAEIVSVLWKRPMVVIEGKESPQVIYFTPLAKEAWRAWYNSHQAERNRDDFPDWLQGPWAKMEQYAGRIALTLHMLHWAADPFRPESSIPDIEPQTVKDAARLVDYLKSNLRRVHSVMRVKTKGNDGGEFAQAILKWVRRNRLESFSERDLNRNFPRFNERAKELRAALSWLVARQCIRRQEAENQAGRPGRKPSPAFDVNPRLAAMLEGRSAKTPSGGNGPETETVNNVDSAEPSEEEEWGVFDDEPSPL
jgi:hypothetical protein